MNRRALGVAALALAITLAAAGGAVARSQATSITVRTTMTVGEETPDADGERRRCTRDVHRHRDEVGHRRGPGLADDVRRPERRRARRPHPRRRGRSARPRRRASLRPLPGPGERYGEHDPGAARGTADTEVRTSTSIRRPTPPARSEANSAWWRPPSRPSPPGRRSPGPRATSARARGSFRAAVTKSGATRHARLAPLVLGADRARRGRPHPHRRAGQVGPVAVPLCGPCRSGVSRTTKLNAAVLTALEAGRAYVNVHTPGNPAGEVRGQIAVLPLSVS